ncbi:hypothetical protein M9H77_16627 [Catharanthus roseus]|uniref:Uncharacterized protein n=1 Tax=Catharanthus roseus TaxID=4058 RepID=A0ACC0B2A5_CATRO|nr:hypothetical protein M9H77_16627 [Catharanthus roseus]
MAVLSSKQILQENNTRDHSSIKSLTLTHKALSDVSCLGEFKNLERLDLGFNSLTSLEGLKSCVNLKWLSVVQNKLQNLKGIEGLTKLTVVLNAGKNKIKSMDEVRFLVSLRALILNDNEITSFCKLDQMKELNTIVLSRNPIREIGDAVSKIKSITKLSLSHCGLQMIGSSLTYCTELKELRLAHNDIKTLPAELSHNTRLQNLDIGNNFITNWSDLKVLSSLVNLKNLNLQGNPIAEKETLSKKVKKLLPNLQIFNAKPIDITMNKGSDRIHVSSLNDENKFVDEKEKIDPAVGKKSNKYLLASKDEDDDPIYNAFDHVDMEKELKLKKHKRKDLPDEQTPNLEVNVGDKKANRKLKSKRDGDKVAGDTEDELTKKKRKKDKASSGQEENNTITEKSSKRSNRKLKQDKGSVLDDGEAPFLELLATDTAKTAINSVQEMDHPSVPDGDAIGFLVTVTKKKMKKNQGGRPASLDLSPVAEVGLGGPSSWDD